MTALNGTSPGKARNRTAVVVIHGMGEQQPMWTLRSFVSAVWQQDQSLFESAKTNENINPNDAWSEPDDLTETTELRHITTRHAFPQNKQTGPRLDFFELYWADLTADTNWGDFRRWFWKLLWRNPKEVPHRLRFVWCVLWLLTAAIGLLSFGTGMPALVKLLGFGPEWLKHFDGLGWWGLFTGLSLALGWLFKELLTAYFGDVARYVSAAPRNIRVRHAARQRGIKLLNELSASNKFDRIVLVGHSLGSLLAHDLVWLAWSEVARKLIYANNSKLGKAVSDCEIAANELRSASGSKPIHLPPITGGGEGAPNQPIEKYRADNFAVVLAKFRRTQRDLFRALSNQPNYSTAKTGAEMQRRWLISDLVTVGSPLTHAKLLIAQDRADLERMENFQEVLRCPPIADNEEEGSGSPNFRFSRPAEGITDNENGFRQLHLGSAMGVVRWTNVHDAAGPLLFFLGDPISGPLAYIDESSPNFGAGIVDVKVDIERDKGLLRWMGMARFFTHSLYWSYAKKPQECAKTPDHVAVLRDAINVLDDEEAEKRLLKRASI